MSNALFYRSALARELTPEVRALIQSLFSRAEQIDSRGGTAGSIPGESRRREGKPPALTKSAKRTIRSFERDSRKAAEELPALVASVPTEALLRRHWRANARPSRWIRPSTPAGTRKMRHSLGLCLN